MMDVNFLLIQYGTEERYVSFLVTPYFRALGLGLTNSQISHNAEFDCKENKISNHKAYCIEEK
jgi:hypothetical protein